MKTKLAVMVISGSLMLLNSVCGYAQDQLGGQDGAIITATNDTVAPVPITRYGDQSSLVGGNIVNDGDYPGLTVDEHHFIADQGVPKADRAPIVPITMYGGYQEEVVAFTEYYDENGEVTKIVPGPGYDSDKDGSPDTKDDFPFNPDLQVYDNPYPDDGDADGDGVKNGDDPYPHNPYK